MDSTASTFPLFNQFPPEIRLCIWEFAVPDDIPELYILGSVLDGLADHPDNDGSSGGGGNPVTVSPEPVRKVLIGIPAVLHTCRESRYAAQAALGFLALETATSHQIQVPYRLYRPGFDAVFVPQSSFIRFMGDAGETEDQPTGNKFFSQIRHLALASSEIYRAWGDVDDFQRLSRCTALRQLSFIFTLPDDDVDVTENWSGEKRLKHFALHEWPEAEGHLIHNTGDTVTEVQSALEDIGACFASLEVDDDSPWDEETGDLLYNLDAKKLIVRRPHW